MKIVTRAAAGVLVLFLAAFAVAQEEETVPQEPPKWDPSQRTYTPKPNETVIKWSFVTERGVMAEKGTGDVYMLLHFDKAPKTCAHILELIKNKFYDGIKIHRIETRADFALVQWGNAETKKPDWDGMRETGSGTTVPRELSDLIHDIGAVGLARSQDPNSGDCQMYVCLVKIPRLDKQYAVFGQVVAGLDVMKYVKIGTRVAAATVVQEGTDAKAALQKIAEETNPGDVALKLADPEGTLKWRNIGNLRLADVKEGEGDPIKEGEVAVVHYTGYLINGTMFDSSRDKPNPFRFKLATGSVIRGWDQGVLGMKVGGVRKLIIPPDLGYGAASVGAIPPNSTLVFEVELMQIVRE